jgi:hypothetical protein
MSSKFPQNGAPALHYSIEFGYKEREYFRRVKRKLLQKTDARLMFGIAAGMRKKSLQKRKEKKRKTLPGSDGE